jgi:outer membrane lipoprotein-sorting protein
MTRPLLVVSLIGALGCTRPNDASPPQLLSQARQALAERERRLVRYAVEVTSTEGGQTATHQFTYRAPNRVKGTVFTPTPVTLSFDGTRLFKLSPGEKKLEVFEVKLPVPEAALFITSQFSPFVPEGYRTPLIPSKGVTVKKGTHPLAGETYEVTVTSPDEANASTVLTTFVLRFPGADFLGKRTQVGAATSELMVEAEACDAALNICVPKVLVQREGGREVGRTTFTRVDLAPQVANDAFTLVAPDGYTVEQRSLLQADPKAPEASRAFRSKPGLE